MAHGEGKRPRGRDLQASSSTNLIANLFANKFENKCLQTRLKTSFKTNDCKEVWKQQVSKHVKEAVRLLADVPLRDKFGPLETDGYTPEKYSSATVDHIEEEALYVVTPDKVTNLLKKKSNQRHLALKINYAVLIILNKSSPNILRDLFQYGIFPEGSGGNRKQTARRERTSLEWRELTYSRSKVTKCTLSNPFYTRSPSLTHPGRVGVIHSLRDEAQSQPVEFWFVNAFALHSIEVPCMLTAYVRYTYQFVR